MKTQLETRLSQLKSEYQSGQKALTELQAKQNEMQATMFRISGAIQVIEEELAKANQEEEKTEVKPLKEEKPVQV